MALVNRIFAFTIMALILLFSLIHVGVSIGIIVPYRKYGDFFRPQIGLSGFNLVISLLGLITGILGLISILVKSEAFGKVVCVLSGVLGIFALASLVAAIIINSKSPNYTSTQFSNNLINYKTNANARYKIDLLQNKYKCCGTHLWVDWSQAELGTTSPVTNGTNTTSSMVSVTNTIVSPISTTPATTASTVSMGNTITTLSPNSGNGKRDINHISKDLHRRQSPQLADLSRKKRQATETYGGIEGLPLSFGVTLPRSCCTSQAILTSNASDSYCISNANDAVNNFYILGCARPIDTTAANQAMGYGVINSFMVVLAFVAIPVLLGTPASV